MTMRKHKPIHPGEVLKHDFLEPMGLSVYRLAKETGISAQHLGRIISGSRNISGDTALRLGRLFGTSAKLWMELQSQYDLDMAEDAAGKQIARQVRPLAAA
ncbi:MAG: HigA family addiction module antitoxin [Phycisphaerales bacterium]